MLKTLFLEEFAALHLNMAGILRGGSKVPHRWFIDPTHVGPVSQKNVFSHQIFSHVLKLYPTDFLYVDRGRDDYYSC